MFGDIKRRLKALEQTGTRETPDLVLIIFDSATSKWKAQEIYTKHDLRGNVIKGFQKVKEIPIDSPLSYKPPEGYIGPIIDEGPILE